MQDSRLTQMRLNQYASLLAPFDAQGEDFSTESLMRDKGPNLTGRKLAKLTSDGVVLAILAQAGVI